MTAIDRAADWLLTWATDDSDPSSYGAGCLHDLHESDVAHALAEHLAAAGLLRSDADQAVLDAADDMADMHGRYDECFPIPCRLCAAVRARREQP